MQMRADEVGCHAFLGVNPNPIFADRNGSWEREDSVGQDLESDLGGKGGEDVEVCSSGTRAGDFL